MTEYDYSPEAYEKYIANQHRIARWVDGTLSVPPRNPFTPATPAGQPLVFQREPEDYSDDDGRSPRHRSPPRPHREHHERRRSDRDRERAREPDREHRSSRTRHRSSSHSAVPRPTHIRSQTLPPPVVYAKHSPPRHSRHSSRSSSATRPQSSSTSTNFPPNQLPWNKYPPPPGVPSKPHRSYTNPQQQHYPYPMDKHHPQMYSDQPVVIPLRPGGGGYTYNRPIDVSNAPQLPYSAYQTQSPTKQQPLLARLFSGLTGGNKHRSLRRKRSTSF